MSDDTHHTFAKEGVSPKRFTCGRKNREQWHTRDAKMVECPQCLAKLRELQAASRKCEQRESGK
jgi:hypothetical protein